MKSIIICGICHKPKKYSDSYVMKVEDYSAMKPEFDSVKSDLVPTIKKVRACKPCTRRMGYKVKAGVNPFKKKGGTDGKK